MSCGERDGETIAAVSSAPGAAERAIVRLSGPRAISAAAELFRPDDGTPPGDLPAYSVVHGVLTVPAFAVPVPALCYLMRAPRSYTREDVVEFHVIGAPPVAAAVLAEVTSRGVRLARPGEFTERAYLSGRIDLSQAEAVLKLIHARSDAERRLALGELTGRFSRRIERLAASLVETLIRVELALDFSEDDVPVIGVGELEGALAGASAEVAELLRSGTGRYVFSERPRVAIVGRTNVGKSSLFNRLLGRDEAIVTDVRGTTRDVLEEELDFEGVQLLLVDTAGEKKPVEDLDEIALERAHAELEQADLVLLVIDASESLTAADMTLLQRLAGVSPLPPASALVVLNKTDLARNEETERMVRTRGLVVAVSCVTGAGLDRLRREIVQALTRRGVERQGLRFLLNLRQLDSLRSAAEALGRASEAVRDGLGLEFGAAEIRIALNHLRELTHPLEEQEILDHIFGRFCVGK